MIPPELNLWNTISPVALDWKHWWRIRKLLSNAVSKPSQIKLKSCSNWTVLVKSCVGPLWTSRTGSSDLNVHIFVKLGKILHKSCGASHWESPKPKSWKLSSKRTISPELNPEMWFSLELWTESNGWRIRKLFFNAVSKTSQVKLKSCSNSTVLVKSCGGPLWTSRSGS